MFLLALCFPGPTFAQRYQSGTSYWKWQTTPDKNNQQLDLTLFLEIKGKKVRGAFSFVNLENGEWDARGDGNVIPFVGKVVGNLLQIEFDAGDIYNREEYDSPLDVVYKKPPRNLINLAEVRIFRGKLTFIHRKGKFVYALPRRMTMRRLK